LFEQFVKRPFHLALYRNGPYAKERSRFLARLVQEGRCSGRLKAINWLLLEVAKHVDLSEDRSYATEVLRDVAQQWQKTRRSRSNSERQARIAVLDFVFVASSWLRFLGRFAKRKEELPYEQYLGEFFTFLREERGLAEATVRGHHLSLNFSSPG
jgi:integrase/recombinase XerD